MLTLVSVLVPALAGAQQVTSTLVGQVQDATGARIADAAVYIRSVDTPLYRRTRSDFEGQFRIADLAPGAYQLTISAPGFGDAESQIDMLVSSSTKVTVSMSPGTVKQSIGVQANASSVSSQPLEMASAVQQAIITRSDLENLPLAARSFANMAYLAPGTEPVEPSDPTKARITAVSSGGSSGLNMEISVDGADDSDDYIGGFLQNVSPDGVQEFAVRTAQETADTSRTTGASIVISTRRGTNSLHGDESFYGRAAALNARFPIDNPAPNPKQPFSRQNYVATLGGPLIRDHAWFFSSFEAVHENASIAYSPASQLQFKALAQLTSAGLIPGIASVTVPRYVPVPFRDYLGMLRLDWSQSPGSEWLLRSGVDNYTTHNAFVQQGALPSTGATSHNSYLDLVLSNRRVMRQNWLATTLVSAGGLHLTEARNSQLGFALAFPFSSTSSTISGLETIGDNQFLTPITAFPVLRNQQKYQARFDLLHDKGRHAPTIGINLIHEPVLGGALSSAAETLVSFPEDPAQYINNAAQFAADYAAGSSFIPASDGTFSQNVKRLGIYAEDVWRVTPRLTMSYGLRWDTTYGLFLASGRTQATNPALLTLRTLSIQLVKGVPHDYRGQVAPRLGLVYSPPGMPATVLRAGFGLLYNDLAQNGWVGALQAVNSPAAPCNTPGDAGCLPAAATQGPVGSTAGSGAIIDPAYRTPYAVHITAGVQHAFNSRWAAGADFTHQQGNHSFRRYQYQAGFTLFSPLYASDVDSQRNNVPDISVFRSDNRSSYNAFSVHIGGRLSSRLDFTSNYTFAKAQTFGCVLGELFDYVNGVCDPDHPFERADYGPSGEDVRHRLVVAGTVDLPGGLRASTITQAESARPFTLTTSVPVTGAGDSFDNRAVVNGKALALDSMRGTPYIQADLRLSRPTMLGDRWSLTPFLELFNVFNRSNPGANYVTDVAALPVPQSEVQAGNITDVCANADCNALTPVKHLGQLRLPGGALGDFFGPGTTVGIPFAAQFGVRASF
ncbi:MAG TPA: TonB-dependent receptor [Acidisarcina sp.]